ncbi:hypothetical protein LTR84_009477 [Exophiala bonariae]|uniref:Cytochrome P450 n=1 Tax=Exophiala bonariae TaxID=1690606 RepID=A0AAV9MU20_9EURO|nr:hypothetical protein LTR84_009477 [Exophiala bonariae]
MASSSGKIPWDTYTRHELFQKYGNVVRTGPNELCFADINSIKEIYGQSAEPCLKNSFYDGFTLTGGTHSVFSSRDRAAHARMRRLLSNGLSERGVLRVQDELKVMIERYLDIILEQSKIRSPDKGRQRETPVIELHDLTHNLYHDIISLLSFGKSFDILANGRKNQGAEDIETYFSICPLYGTFPLARYLPFGIFKAARQAQPRIIKFVQSCIDDYRDRLTHEKNGGAVSSQEGLLRLMLEAKDEETGTTFSDEELIENAVIFILAGSGTTASTLLYLIYELGRRPHMQRRLEKEIRDAFPEPAVFPDFDTATRLPYLNNIVQEVLRLRGPIPTTAPRLSPGKSIGGHHIPAGVTVSNLPYSTQRDATVFPDPHTFEPDRWDEPTPEMKLMNRPFSSGPRNCVGMHLARVQLFLTVVALYQRFDIEVDPSTTEEMMVLRDQGIMTPVGRKLWSSESQDSASPPAAVSLSFLKATQGFSLATLQKLLERPWIPK